MTALAPGTAPFFYHNAVSFNGGSMDQNDSLRNATNAVDAIPSDSIVIEPVRCYPLLGSLADMVNLPDESPTQLHDGLPTYLEYLSTLIDTVST